ncbi:hypothetical protein CRENBAI_005086 [Crenichthys baileyi]|uniref:Uncharacterized protein n=1 Tax=Crenichthys baileyi TaxID=28760 RepID=A0AAV9SF64_9TELE
MRTREGENTKNCQWKFYWRGGSDLPFSDSQVNPAPAAQGKLTQDATPGKPYAPHRGRVSAKHSISQAKEAQGKTRGTESPQPSQKAILRSAGLAWDLVPK